jgi:hypothetical protein
VKETQQQQQGFWGTLARKAKSILDDDFNTSTYNAATSSSPQKQQMDSGTDRTTTWQHHVPDTTTKSKVGYPSLTFLFPQYIRTQLKVLSFGKIQWFFVTLLICQKTRKLNLNFMLLFIFFWPSECFLISRSEPITCDVIAVPEPLPPS